MMIDDKKVLTEILLKELLKVKKWHKKTFPDATLNGQLAKLEEEMNEFVKAKTREEETKELADIMIVCAGLDRWNSKVGNYVVSSHLENMPITIICDLILAINEKMKKNQKRVWKKTSDGRFHHTNKE